MPAPTDEEIISTLAGHLPVGVWVARAPNGEFVYANETFREIMGVTARPDVAAGEYADPYGIHDLEGNLYPEEKMPFVLALGGETVVADDIVIHRHDGRKVNIRAQARPIKGEDGDITHVVIAFIDVSREFEAERRRQESEEAFRRTQKLESVGMLAGGIAHDFNNLLTVVKAVATRLRITATDVKLQKDLMVIDDVVDRAVALTRSLLAFTRREAGKSEPVEVSQLIHSVTALVERTIDPRITLSLELCEDAVVFGESSRLEQVVMNLLMNARDAVSTGGHISVSCAHEGDTVRLVITDDGPGVPPDIVPRIFDPYFTTKERPGRHGTGLGLAITEGIVIAHSGRVHFEAPETGGARFIVELPFYAGDRTSAPADADPAPQPLVPGGTVLLVEDDARLRGVATQLLERIGFEVIAAADGLEAISLFEARPGAFRGVVLDLTMPRLSGAETFTRLKALDPEVRVVLTSGYTVSETADDLLAEGVRVFLSKPYDETGLRNALARALA